MIHSAHIKEEMAASGSSKNASEEVFSHETERIRIAYAKRIDSSLYSFWEPAQLLAVQERERKLLSLLAAFGFAERLRSAKILEIGCGSGLWLREFVRWGAQPENILGIDLLPERIAAAKRSSPAGISLMCQDASNLQNLPHRFDLILQATVFTSILSSEVKIQIANQMLSALDGSGLIVWYDFLMDNPANADVRGIKRQEIEQLFPNCEIHLNRVTLAPPIGRPVARVSHKLYGLASAMKPLCSHYLGIVRKK